MNLTSSPALLGLASVAFAGLLLPSLASAQSVIHSWNFNTASTKNLQTYDSTWAGWGSQTATDPAPDTYTSYTGYSVTTSARLHVGFLASGGGDTTSGVLFSHTGSGAPDVRNDRFAAVTTFSGVSNVGTVTWDQRSNSNVATSFVRILVQVDGQWYASNNSFLFSAASTYEANTLDLSSATLGLGTTAWRAATFGDGLSVSVASTAVLDPIGTTLTGLGFYINAGSTQNRDIRLDNLVLNSSAIPEPATFAALLGFGALALPLVSRRRRG